MRRESVHDICKDVFSYHSGLKDLGKWVSMKCPLATWRHEKGHDRNPSAGISTSEDGMSFFNCYSCHSKMPLSALIRQYGEYTGEDYSELEKEIEDEEYLGPKVLDGWDAVMKRNLGELLMPLDESIYMGLYPSAKNHPYLRERGISNRTIALMELRFDPGDTSQDGAPRIVFPVRGLDGLLYGFSGRDTSGTAQMKVKDYFGFKKAQNVLGAHLLADYKDVCVVEGLIDVAAAFECGQGGAGVMHSTMTEFQANILREVGKPTYLFYDDDKAGHDGVRIAGDQLYQYLPVMTVQYPEVWIEDDSAEGGHWLEDPGEMTREEFEAMKKNSEFYIPFRKGRLTNR